MNMILVYITSPTKKEAKKIAIRLLKKKLIACANIFPISSIFRWNGKIQESKEFVLLCKTKDEKFKLLKKEVEKIHPYSVPCIIKIPVSANEKFLKWVETETD